MDRPSRWYELRFGWRSGFVFDLFNHVTFGDGRPNAETEAYNSYYPYGWQRIVDETYKTKP